MLTRSPVLLLTLTTSLLAAPAAANESWPDLPGCYWGSLSSGPADVTIPLPGPLYVATTDAESTVVGTFTVRGVPTSPGNWRCYNPLSVTPVSYYITANALLPTAHLTRPLAGNGSQALPPPGKVLQTSVPGIGVAVDWGYGYQGEGYDYFDAGGPPFAPFNAEMKLRYTKAVGYIADQRFTVHVVKTGEVVPGRYTFDPAEKHFNGVLSGPDANVGNLWNVGVSGEVIVTGCGTAANPITPNPVDLGSHDVADLSKGGTTPAVPFRLNLTGCIAPVQGTFPGIHVQMDPAQGSAIVDAERGVFSLSKTDGAENVGIQLLREDAQTPLPLGRKLMLQLVPNGDVTFGFNARMAKLNDPIKPGPVEAAVKFTVSYE